MIVQYTRNCKQKNTQTQKQSRTRRHSDYDTDIVVWYSIKDNKDTYYIVYSKLSKHKTPVRLVNKIILPSRGTASEVAGIVSATILRNTVSESKIVTPRYRE